jgi:ABC-type transport system substrate-binding protein
MLNRIFATARMLVVVALLVQCAATLAQPRGRDGTIRVAFQVAEAGFDPQAVYDAYSADVCTAIFEPLYRYDYFARPVRMEPAIAAALPDVTDGGRTYTIRIKRGIRFTPDPAFKGKPRELVADDYVYAIKRVLDPKVRSYWLYLLEHRLLGADDVLADARRTGRFDYDAPLEGARALDRYTLQVKFNEPSYGFAHWLTTIYFSAIAREVVDAYKDTANRVMENPVGYGPYKLAEWRRSQRIVLEANPDYRDVRYPSAGAGSEPGDATIAKGLAGRRLPLTRRVEIAIVEEAQPRLLAFQSGETDYASVPSSLANKVLDGAKLRPEFAKIGVRLHRVIEPSHAFTFFNLDDAVVGGYTPDKLALRRAIAMAYDRDTSIRVLNNGQAEPATQLPPPGVPGHDPAQRQRVPFDLAAARVLLDRFGYKDRDGDGYRELPDGKPLTIVKGSTPDAAARDTDDLWKKNLDAIGIRIQFLKQKWPELNKMSEAGQLQMWNLAWLSSIPDADTFYSTLYSPNIGTSNDARLRLPDYDRTYEAARALPDGPKRWALYRKLDELIAIYTPWILGTYPYENVLTQPWLKGYKHNPFQRHQWQFYAIERNGLAP